MASLMCATFFCEDCQKQRKFLPIDFAVAVTGASRSSMYRWMERSLLHYMELPTGHRLICLPSLRKIHPVDSGLLATLIKKSRPRRPTKHN